MTMNKLYSALNRSNDINTIEADNFEEAIRIAYKEPAYDFFHNSELLDVKNRFRIFRYRNIEYLIKYMSPKKSKIEMSKTLQASKLITGKKVNNFQLEVIEPKLYSVDGNYYIVTNYKGNTLQEYLYSQDESSFTIDDFEKMLKLLCELGIEYPGFCPRNMVVSREEQKIYLFDFENANFFEKVQHFNLLYRTNLFINWSYLYDLNLIKNVVDNLEIQNGIEPQLNTYESDFKEILGYSGNDLELRKKIMEIVLIAEQKTNIKYDNYCLLPIDMASIISDLFDFNMDAIMDMTFYAIRKTNQKLYEKILVLFNDTIIQAYQKNLRLDLALLPVLLYSIDSVNSNDNFNSKLIYYCFNNDIKCFYERLKNKLEIIFKIIYPTFTNSKLDIEKIGEYLMNIGNSSHTLNDNINDKFDKNKIRCYNNTNFR